MFVVFDILSPCRECIKMNVFEGLPLKRKRGGTGSTDDEDSPATVARNALQAAVESRDDSQLREALEAANSHRSNADVDALAVEAEGILDELQRESDAVPGFRLVIEAR